MLARGRPIKSHLSGGSTLRVPSDLRALPEDGSGPRPATHGLLVALVSAPGLQPNEVVTWPLWLIPRIARPRNGRIHSRGTDHPRLE